jgi:hypothetical protein
VVSDPARTRLGISADRVGTDALHPATPRRQTVDRMGIRHLGSGMAQTVAIVDAAGGEASGDACGNGKSRSERLS